MQQKAANMQTDWRLRLQPHFFLQCLQINQFMNLKYIHFAKTNENELSLFCLQGLLIYGLRKRTVAYFMI